MPAFEGEPVGFIPETDTSSSSTPGDTPYSSLEPRMKGEEIVISGIGGRYPDCDNVQQFWDKLLSGEEMLTIDERRWPVGYLSLPKRAGKIRDIDRSDYEFFNLTEHDANYMDVQLRLLLETTYEAIWDAGVDPSSLRGTNTGIFTGICYDDTGTAYAQNEEDSLKYLRLTVHHLVQAFDFRGPACSTDTACASSFSAFYQAFLSLKAGLCEQAIVCGAAVHLRPTVALGFHNLRMISDDGRSKCLDANADGYGRSEAAVSIFLQKKGPAKRIYATVINSRTNTDGYKQEGITYPSIRSQQRLMSNTNAEVGINPHDITYVEAHMTGTPAGDQVESESIRRAFCEDGRPTPLLMGCLKSNLGHTEAASGMCALTKVCLAFANRELPPNLHLKTPHPDIIGLRSGIIKPVLQRTKFEDRVVGVSSFGFGGCNVYTILEGYDKYIDNSCTRITGNNGVPRIINACGRTKEAVNYIFDYIATHKDKVTKEFLALLSDSTKTNPSQGMHCRGYMIMNEGREVMEKKVNRVLEKKPLWFAFSGLNCKWPSMGKSLMGVEVFAKSIQTSAKVVKTLGINLMDLIQSEKKTYFAEATVAVVAIQIALVDLLRNLGLEPDGLVGQSVGEIVCGYADGCLTAEQTLLTAHCMAKHMVNNNKRKLSAGSMGSMGLGCNDPNGNEVQTNGTNGVGGIEEVYEPLFDSLSKIINKPKARTSRWLSTSIPENKWHEKEWKRLTPAYFVCSLMSNVQFNDVLQYIPKNAVVVEISPDAILGNVLRTGLGPDITYIQTMIKSKSNVENILNCLGSIYAHGHNLDVEKLYPKVEYPVPQGTLSLSPLLMWDHSKICAVTKYPAYFSVIKAMNTWVVDLMQPSHQYLSGHVIDGRNLLPAIEYLRVAWEQYGCMVGTRDYFQLPVEFKNVRLFRATMCSRHKPIELQARVIRETGEFTVTESGNVCVTGFIFFPKDPSTDELESLVNPYHDPDALTMQPKDIYKEFRVRGYDYGATFQGVAECSSDGSKGKVKWMGQWVSFADSMLQMAIFGEEHRSLRIPTYIEYIKCNPKVMMANIEACKDEMGDSIVNVVYDKNTRVGATKGIVVMGLKTSAIPRRGGAQKATLESFDYVPYDERISLPDEKVNRLTRYSQLCHELIDNIKRDDGPQNEQVTSYLSGEDKLHTVLRLLNEVTQLTEEEQEQPKKSWDIRLKEKLEKYATDLALDSLTSLPLSCEKLSRNHLDVFIENSNTKKITILEANPTNKLFAPLVTEFIDSNYVAAEYSVLHPTPTAVTGQAADASLIQWKLASSSEIPSDLQNIDLLIYKDNSASIVLNQEATTVDVRPFFESSFNALKENGFILIYFRDRLSSVEEAILSLLNVSGIQLMSSAQMMKMVEEVGFFVISEKVDNYGIHSLLVRKPENLETNQPQVVTVAVTGQNYEWVNELKAHLVVKEDEDKPKESDPKKKKVWLVAEDSPNGLVGLVNCLRREPGCDQVRCFFNVKAQKNGPIRIPEDVLRKDLVMNVFSQGSVGSYRHSTIEAAENYTETEHAYVDIKTKGDMSSFRWYEGSQKFWPTLPESAKLEGETLCHVYYAPLNFKDVMIASGRIPLDAYPGGMGLAGGLIGMEFSGRDLNGNRLMGYTICKAIATTVMVHDPLFLWPVPKQWTLEDASTVPVVYSTVYYALIIRGCLQRGETILIHSGAGGVGQAAISLCLSMGCKVYTSCGSQEKRDFLKTEFGLNDNQICNSRDLSFEDHILNETNGHGVDLVLNSLSEAKLKASVRCLADSGRFIEIGKYDIITDNPMDMTLFGINKTLHTICLAHLDYDALITKTPSALAIRRRMHALVQQGIDKGEVRPLKGHFFDKEQVEDAFRFMASGKHIGKVVIKMREEETGEQVKTVPTPLKMKAIKQTFFHPMKSYVITGGLGGFGLELAYWMVTRGARKLVLSSRKGIKDSYQEVSVRRMREMKKMNCKVIVSTCDLTSLSGATELIKEAQALGPVGGIFNLAMVLKDSTLENQTPDSFREVCGSKAHGTIYLDQLTRKSCPQLDHFVCFSSVVAGRGNGGQTNYGFANSLMERVCEDRKREGLPALAIQWGAVGDVGVVAEVLGGNDVVIGGSVPQRMPSCFKVLDEFMQTSSLTVCSSIVRVNNKKMTGGGKGDVVGTVCHILGIKDPSSVDPNSTLGELGMDSLMAIEIKQGLEREYDIVMSTQEIRDMQIKNLKLIQATTKEANGDKKKAEISESVTIAEVLEQAKGNFVKLNDIEAGKPIFIFPPIEGSFRILKNLGKNIGRPLIGLNWTDDVNKINHIRDVVQYYIHLVRQNYPDSQYDFIGYDMGGVLALETSVTMQHMHGDKCIKKVALLDTSPDIMKELALNIINRTIDDSLLYVELLLEYVSIFFPVVDDPAEGLRENLLRVHSREERNQLMAKFVGKQLNEDCDPNLLGAAVDRFYKKLKMMSTFELSRKLTGQMGLIRATESYSSSTVATTDANYGLLKTLNGSDFHSESMSGDHRSFLVESADDISQTIDNYFLIAAI